MTFFPEGKAVADWRAFEDVFAGRVAVKGGPEGKAVGAVGAEKVKAGAEAVMEGCRNLNLERGIFRWDSENPLFFSLPHGEKAGGAAFSAGSRTAEFEP